jgi:hypothetical protein
MYYSTGEGAGAGAGGEDVNVGHALGGGSN